MKESIRNILEYTIINHPMLERCRPKIMQAFLLLKQCYSKGGKVLLCGNGGSAADSEHIVGELMKGFLLKRKISSFNIEKFKAAFPDDWIYFSNNLQGALPAISLVSQISISTAFINDLSADMVYAQQVYGYAKEGDILIGISTSGNSKNVVNALKVAKVLGVGTIGLTGESGGIMNDLCDVIITVPETETYRIQELHLPVYHTLCAMVEANFFEE
ncbi:MAG: D-sedoheptulose-7-phosphate isomerase [Desulfitobacteriaceae bacterium]